MAPTPKPPGQRVRRNKDQPTWRQLPAEGRAGDPPALPGQDEPDIWLGSTLEWWRTLWCSPMATMYEEADVDPLKRLARLKDDFDRGDLPVSAFAALQQLEDRYGLSPKARRALQWEINRDQGEAKQQAPAKVRRLRAVDAAAG